MDPVDFITRGLDCFSQTALKEIAGNLGLKASTTQRSALISTLSTLIGTAAHIQVLNARVDPVARALLGTLPALVGPVSLRHFLAVVKQRGVTGKAATGLIRQLLTHGCLLPVDPLLGSNRLGLNVGDYGFVGALIEYWVPPGLDGWAKEERAAANNGKIQTMAPPGDVLGSALQDLLRMLYVLTSELARRPIRLTQSGMPNRSDLSRLTKVVSQAGIGSGARTGVEPPALLWFGLAVAAAVGLIEEVERRLQSTSNVGGFFEMPLEHRVERLMEGWRLGVFNDLAFVPTLWFAGGQSGEPWLYPARDGYSYGPNADIMALARTYIFSFMLDRMETAPDAWYAFDAFSDALFHEVPELLFPRVSEHELYSPSSRYDYGYGAGGGRHPTYPGVYRRSTNSPGAPTFSAFGQGLSMVTDWPEVEGAFIRRAIGESMRWLGLVEVDRPAPGEHPTCFHLTPLGQHLMVGRPLTETEAPVAPGRAVIQPSFEIVVMDAAQSWRLLAQLDEFAERRSLDRAATYRLTQAALVSGLDHGWTGQRVLDVLEATNGNPLPQNVRFSLEEWIGRYEALTLREHATLIEADSEAQLDRWLANPEIAPLLGRRLNATTVLAPKTHLDLLIGRVFTRGVRSNAVDYGKPLDQVLTIREPDVIEIPPAQADPYLVYRLAQFSEIDDRKNNDLVRYRISQDSIGRAVREGLPPKEILGFLSSVSPKGLPIDFATRVRGWGAAIPPACSEPLIGVALQTDQVSWGDLRKIKAISHLICAVPTPRLALVAPPDFDELQRELRSRGIEVETGHIEEEASDRVSQLRRAVEAFSSADEAVKQMEALGLFRRASSAALRGSY